MIVGSSPCLRMETDGRGRGRGRDISAHSVESKIRVPVYTDYLAMRRTIALSLLTMFSWMLIAPLFGPDAEANLPPCCRRNGRHHCMMRMMGGFGANRSGFTSVSEMCPCFPASTCAVHSSTYKPETVGRFYDEVAGHPVLAAQTVALSRISFLCGHQRRSPPTPLV